MVKKILYQEFKHIGKHKKFLVKRRVYDHSYKKELDKRLSKLTKAELKNIEIKVIDFEDYNLKEAQT